MRCQGCGETRPTKQVTFRHNIGLVILRLNGGVSGQLCRSCIDGAFFKHMAINLLFGWWGVISFFVTPIFAVMNLAEYVGAMSLPRQ